MTTYERSSLPVAIADPASDDPGVVVRVVGGTASATNQQVVGNVADAAADSGNPVKIGAIYKSTLPTYTDGQRGNAHIGTRGGLNVSIMGADQASGAIVLADNADGVASESNQRSLKTMSRSSVFNGTAWDRERGNTDLTILASAARTATNQSSDQTNYNGRGLHLVIDVTAASATPSVVFTIQGKDALSGKYYTILASAAIVGTGTTVLRVFPGSTVTANVAANDILPRTWRIDATHADADSITYSVGASVIL